jgi:hypothetical protein
LANPFELGGFEEFFEVGPSRASSSAIRPRRTQLRRQRLDQLITLRKPLTQLHNQQRLRHREIINTPDEQDQAATPTTAT